MIFSLKFMAQSHIVFSSKASVLNTIIAKNNDAERLAKLLQSFLDKSNLPPFKIQSETVDSDGISIYLLIENRAETIANDSFEIKSNVKDIFLIAPNEKLLRYAVYTFLEDLGYRKFTAKEFYIPSIDEIKYPKNSTKTHQASFTYRALYYPDAFDADFREWHKLDWHLNDFTIWGHTFDKLLPAKDYFEKNPDYFAFYEGRRRPESFCMTNDAVFKIVVKKMLAIIAKNANAEFTSVSQNDDGIFCECKNCKYLNNKHGGPQGSLYFFLNKVAQKFPANKIMTLAYQHTFKPPVKLKLRPNIYSLICPIDLNRGKSISSEGENKEFIKIIKSWSSVTSNLFLWDYTVQFSNYMSPFPNIHTFSDNYKFFKQSNVKGLFVQGYADVPGDMSELRQYLLAKLLWNVDIDIEETISDFLRGYYGEAAPYIKEYLKALTYHQNKTANFLDIYSGPVQSRNSFLSDQAMDLYDNLLDKAANSVTNKPKLYQKIEKLRLALEFVYFEQSKFYGADKHGMFDLDESGNKILKKGLNERVFKFAKQCEDLGIYEMSEAGITPAKYYENWIEITKNTRNHLGEKLTVNLLTNPSNEFKSKGSATLVDGILGHKDFNINWIGWYGNNPEIEFITGKLNFNNIYIQFLDNQRNWIFLPKSVEVLGFKNNIWISLVKIKCDDLSENNVVNIKGIKIENDLFGNFGKIKIVVQNQNELPVWRKRKNKKPMVMIGEIELYQKRTINVE